MDRVLLFSVTKKNLVIQYFSGKGAGGQHRNKSQNCVRMIHPDSGASVIATEQRSRRQNLKMALKRLAKHKKFNIWVRIKASEITLDTYDINKEVDEMMSEENLKIEYFTPGRNIE